MKALFPILLMIALVAPANAEIKNMTCTQLVDTGLMYQSWGTPKRWASVEFDDSYDKVFYLHLHESKTALGIMFGESDLRLFKCDERRRVIECMSETGFMDTPDYGTTHLFYLSNDLKRFQYIIPSEQAYLEGDMGNVRVAIGDCVPMG
ncbi:hypothetical protein ACYVU7_12185 [Arenicellales bacterium IMCC56312]